MRDHEPREIEFKLRTRQPLEVASVDACLREAPPNCVALDSELHRDVYVDTDDFGLRARGAGLRLRTTAGPASPELTFKSRVRRDGARHERIERTVAWPSAQPPSHVDQLPGDLHTAVLALVGHASLAPVLTLLVDRERRSLRNGDVELCEVAIDRVEAERCGRRATFAEVEVEVRGDGDVAASISARLQRELGLEPAADDKPSHALAQLGVAAAPSLEAAPAPATVAPAAPPPAEAGEPGQAAATTAAEDPLASAVQAQCAAWQAAVGGFGSEPSPALVHAYRVALRHLRTLLACSPERWPGDAAATLAAELAGRAEAAATTRTFDVLLTQLEAALADAPPALAEGAIAAREWFRRQRTASAVRFAAELPHDERLVMALADLAPPASDLAAPWPTLLRDHVLRFRKRLRRAIEANDLDTEHRARLATKRLRQLAAMLPAIATELGDKRLRRLAELQHRLGERRDLEAAIAGLTARLAATPPPPTAEAAALGAALATLTDSARRAAKGTQQLLQKLVRRRVWRDLLAE